MMLNINDTEGAALIVALGKYAQQLQVRASYDEDETAMFVATTGLRNRVRVMFDMREQWTLPIEHSSRIISAITPPRAAT
jgi:hypothetical protein